jgi:Chitobiase/beta-hexosaminidase C-terminal domain
MATATIPMLPQSIGLTGAEQLEAVQAGSSVRVTAQQIANLITTPGTTNFLGTFANFASLVSGPVPAVGFPIAYTVDEGFALWNGSSWQLSTIPDLLQTIGPASSLPPAALYPNFVALTTDQGVQFSNGITWAEAQPNVNVPVLPGVFTFATLPSSVANPNVFASTSDKGAVFSNGAAWLLLFNPTNGTVQISNNSPLPAGVNGTAYTDTITITNAVAPVTWSIVSTFASLNLWTIAPTTGVISLTPTHTENSVLMVQAIDATGAADQKLFTINVTAGALTPAATPTFSPAAGTYAVAQTVTISCSTPSSSIFYTTNGSTPTTSSTPYTTPITVSITSTVQAIATASGFSQSAIGSAAYTITAAGAVYKFNPGDYDAGSQVEPATAQWQADINDLATNSTGVTGYLIGVRGGNIVNGSTFDNSISNAQGALGNYTGFSTIGSAFNYLQSKIPGARMGVLISDDVAWNKAAPTGTLTSLPVPGFILNAPSGVIRLPTNFGDADSGPTTWTSYTMTAQTHAFGGGGQYGWGVSGWNNLSGASAQYAYLTPAFWDPAVNQYLILARQALSKYVLPAGSSFAGQTLDACPLIEFVGSNDEVSYSFGVGTDPYNPVGTGVTAPTPANFHTQYFAMASAWAAAFPHTMVPLCISFGFASHSGNDTAATLYTTYMPALAAITGIVMSGADHVATAWVGGQGSGDVQSTWAQQAFIGIQVPAQGLTLQTPTGTSRAGVMPYFSQTQPTDYGGTGHQAPLLPIGISQATSALVQSICSAWGSGSSAKIKPTHRLWWNTDATFLTGKFQGYIRPGFTTGVTFSTVRPSNLP